MTRKTTMMTLAAVALNSGSALAQSTAEREQPRPVTVSEPQLIDLRVVDEGIEDVGALNESLRTFSPGLHQPNDFSRVYQAPDGDSFMRVQGALYAIYPQSVYSSGGAAAIPPGTVFNIGGPSPFDDIASRSSSSSTPSELPPGAALRWNTRLGAVTNDEHSSLSDISIDDAPSESGRTVSTDVPPRRTSSTVPTESEDDNRVPAIIGNEDYRRQRLQELMRRAAQASSAAR